MKNNMYLKRVIYLRNKSVLYGREFWFSIIFSKKTTKSLKIISNLFSIEKKSHWNKFGNLWIFWIMQNNLERWWKSNRHRQKEREGEEEEGVVHKRVMLCHHTTCCFSFKTEILLSLLYMWSCSPLTILWNLVNSDGWIKYFPILIDITDFGTKKKYLLVEK